MTHLTPEDFHSNDFRHLRNLQRYLDSIKRDHVNSLSCYFDPDNGSFRRKYRTEGESSGSPASSGTAIISLAEAGKWDEFALHLGTKSEEIPKFTNEVAQNLKALAKIKLDCLKAEEGKKTKPYTIHCLSLLSEALCSIDDQGEIADIVDALKETFYEEGSLFHDGYPSSAYLTQLVFRTLKRYDAVDSDMCEKIRERAYREVERQLSLSIAGSKNADVCQLAYSLILTAECRANLKPDENLVLRAGLQHFFEAQLPDGTWPRSAPQFQHDGDGAVFCYEYEMLSQLLRCDLLQDHMIRYHLGALARAASALQDSATVLEDETSERIGRGWSSGHRPTFAGPESWSTASVFMFAHYLDRVLAKAIRETVFREMEVDFALPSKVSNFAEDFLDSDLFEPNVAIPHSTKAILLNRFVNPIKREAPEVQRGRPMSSSTPISAILFGPPGTSKTQLAEHIAKYLGWPLLAVNPSYFEVVPENRTGS